MRNNQEGSLIFIDSSCQDFQVLSIEVIEAIKPEVIAQEIPPSYFVAYYAAKNAAN